MIERIEQSNLNDDEKAAWHLYLIQDQMKVKRMALEREQAKRYWDLNWEHAKAIVVMRDLGIRPHGSAPPANRTHRPSNGAGLKPSVLQQPTN